MNQRSLTGLNLSKGHNKVNLLAFLAVIFSFIFSTIVSITSLRMMSDENARDSNSVITELIFDKVVEHLIHPIISAKTMANDEYFINTLKNEDENSVNSIKDYLRGFTTVLGYDLSFVISENSRKLYTTDGIKKIVDLNQDPYDKWYFDFINKNVEYQIKVAQDHHKENRWTVFFENRIFDRDGKLYGVCGVGVKLSTLQEKFKQLEEQYDVKINLVDSSGQIQIDSDSVNIGKSLSLLITEEDKHLDLPIYLDENKNNFRTSKFVPQLGWYLIVKNNNPVESAIYIKVIFINVVLCIFMSMIIIFIIQYLIYKASSLSEESVKDALTKAYNRRAFDNDRESLRNEKVHNLCVLFTDIDVLKTTNREHSFEKGDETILGAYECLKAVFSKYGFIYRIGGDDFVLFLTIEHDELENSLKELRKEETTWSKLHNLELHLSIGYSSRITYPYMTVDELLANANEMMRKNKKAYYEEKNSVKESLLIDVNS